MIIEPATHERIRALATAVCDGELTPERREHLVALLHSVGTVATLAPRAQENCPDNDGGSLGYMIGTWAPVATAYAELAGTVSVSGAGFPAS